MPDPAQGARAPTILNINDHEGSPYVVSAILRRAGFEVIEGQSGQEALELAEAHDPELLVLDVSQPDLNGLEICRRIRANPRTASIKVLHTSTRSTSLDSKAQSLPGMADGYLTQPFEAEELLATVQTLVRLRQVERELRAVAEQLREADRRKNEFLAMLAHELRNPLAAISTSMALIGAPSQADPLQQRARDVLTRQVQHLGRLVDDLLDVARVTQGRIALKRAPLELDALLRRVVDNARATRTTARSQTLELTLPTTSVTVAGDATRLEQVFANLLDNASKYTPVGGHIHVTLESHASQASHEAHVTVRDDGTGISPEMLPTIFQLFSQAEASIARSSGGVGVGLTLVQTLVELHGGSVVARSGGPGRGSEFKVVLPAQAVEARAEPAEEVRGESAPPARRRVLLVEDNADALEVLSDLLELWGHEVRGVPDGLTAVDAALAMQPDVALIDIGLPGIDGYEVARRIRAMPSGRRLRLVALTGYGSPEQRALAAEAGFDLHLVKPIQPDGLARLLSESTRAGA